MTIRHGIHTCLLMTSMTLALNNVEESYWHLAQALHAEQNTHETIETCKKLLERNPQHAGALLLLGTSYYQQQQTSLAIGCFEQRLAMMPTCATTHLYTGIAYGVEQQFTKAITHYTKALEVDPSLIKAYEALGIAYEKNNQLEEAIKTFQKGLHLAPDQTEFQRNIARLLKKSGNYDQALYAYDTLLQKDPSNEEFLYAKAQLFTAVERFDEGLALYNALLQKKPSASLMLEAAKAYTKAGSFSHAITLYQKIMSGIKNKDRIHFELAKLNTLIGNMQQAAYHLHHTNDSELLNHPKCLKNLSGLQGKTVLIHGEWMLEDMLHCIRFAKILKNVGARVVVKTPKALKPVLALCPYIDLALSLEDREQCSYDLFIPLFSLTYVLGHEEHQALIAEPYLAADEHLAQRWQERMSHDGGPQIGIYLPTYTNITIKQLCDHLPNEATLYLVSPLGKYETLAECLPSQHIHCFGRGLDKDDLASITALIHNLDVVITGNNTIAHLAAALGKKTYVLIKKEDTLPWRWLHEEHRHTWYPSVTLIFQSKDGSWDLSALTR